MDRAGPGGADAYAKPAGMFGKTRGHEGSGLFVADADVANPVLAFAQGFDQRIDAVADDAEGVGSAPIDQRLDDDIGGGLIGFERPRNRLRRDRRTGLR